MLVDDRPEEAVTYRITRVLHHCGEHPEYLDSCHDCYSEEYGRAAHERKARRVAQSVEKA